MIAPTNVHLCFQAENAVARCWGEKRSEPKLKNHVELVELLGIADLKKGKIVHSLLLCSTCEMTLLSLQILTDKGNLLITTKGEKSTAHHIY